MTAPPPEVLRIIFEHFDDSEPRPDIVARLLNRLAFSPEHRGAVAWWYLLFSHDQCDFSIYDAVDVCQGWRDIVVDHLIDSYTGAWPDMWTQIGEVLALEKVICSGQEISRMVSRKRDTGYYDGGLEGCRGAVLVWTPNDNLSTQTMGS